MWASILLLTYAILQAQGNLLCRECKDISSPSSCRDIIACGQGEICYTREFTDRFGYQGYRMGCEAQRTCDLLLHADSLIGKRHTSVEDSTNLNKCFHCCSSDMCNVYLCQNSVVGQSHGPTTSHSVAFTTATTALITTTTTTTTTTAAAAVTTTTTTTTPYSSSGCPDFFVKFREHCYFFAPGTAYWHTARPYCLGHGADLLSVNSKEEHDFLIRSLNYINATYTSYFWMDGIYSHPAHHWEWLDGSSFNYSLWYPAEPQWYDYRYTYYAALANPPYSPVLFQHAPFGYSTAETLFGVICRKRLTKNSVH